MTDDLTAQVREALDAPCGCVHQNRTALNDGSDVPTPLRLRECSRCYPVRIEACMRAVYSKMLYDVENGEPIEPTDTEADAYAAGLAKLRGET